MKHGVEVGIKEKILDFNDEIYQIKKMLDDLDVELVRKRKEMLDRQQNEIKVDVYHNLVHK